MRIGAGDVCWLPPLVGNSEPALLDRIGVACCWCGGSGIDPEGYRRRLESGGSNVTVTLETLAVPLPGVKPTLDALSPCSLPGVGLLLRTALPLLSRGSADEATRLRD